MHKRITTFLSTSMLALGLSSGAAIAQNTTANTQSGTSMSVPTPNYSDSQLERFVNASRKVAMISQEYTPKLEATANEAGKKKVFEEADGKMIKAVHDEGMTVDQFNGINQALQQDPKLVQRVQKIAE